MRSQQYRERAAACLLAAGSVTLADGRNRMLAMAQASNRLADGADRRDLHESLIRGTNARETSSPL